MTEILKRYLAKTKEPALSLLLASGVWIANEVKHAVADVADKVDKLDQRIAALERSVGHHTAAK